MTDKESQSSGRVVNTASHVIFILILFVLPEVMMAIAMPHRQGFGVYPDMYLKTFIYICVFYLNYLLIIERTLASGSRNRRIGQFIAVNICLLVVGLGLCWLLWHGHDVPHTRRPHHGPEHNQILKTAMFLLRDGVMIILTIALAVALKLSAKWHDLERQRQELIANQRAVELDNLKSQLNPHFLFNTLNTIYALIAVAPDKAQGAVHRLSGLLRYMLYEDDLKVRLKQETDFIENYVTLMRLRLSDRQARLNVDIAGNEDAMIPPLLFIPLIENAFKYGTDSSDDTPIDISICIEGQEIVCTTSNAYIAGASGGDCKSSGIGLTNLRRRLSLIYGSEASLKTEADGHIYTATLKIPL